MQASNTLENFSLTERQIPIYRIVVFCEYTYLRKNDGGRFFISQISPKGKRESILIPIDNYCKLWYNNKDNARKVCIDTENGRRRGEYC